MSSIAVPAKVIILGPQLHNHQRILFMQPKLLHKLLNSVRPLFVPDQLPQIRQNTLQYLQPLISIAHHEQPLHHVISIFMLYQLNEIGTDVGNYLTDLTLGTFSQVVLEQTGLDVVLDKGQESVSRNQVLKVDGLTFNFVGTARKASLFERRHR